MTSQGEALVPGVRVVRLHGPVRVEIERSRGELESSPAIEAEWNRKRALNARLHDAPVLSVRSIDAARGVISCGLDSYKRLVVQPAVETGVRQLSVTGVLIASDAAGGKHVLLGRRSHQTRMYGGMWQNCPAGGIDPEPDATTIGQEGIAAELLREVKEEAGLDVKSIGTPVAIIYDETARSHDLIVPVEVGEVPATVRGWEYDELRWVDTRRLTEFEAAEGARIMPITRAVFRVMGWVIRHEDPRLAMRDVAQRVLDRTLEPVEGARSIYRLWSMASSEKWSCTDADYLRFKGIDSETDDLPFGDQRRLWASDSLTDVDRELKRLAGLWGEQIRSVCKRIVTESGDWPP